MGNENSKSKDPNRNGTISQKRENGASTTSNGLKTASNTIIQQNDTPAASNPTTESHESDDYVMLDSGGQHAPVTPEAPTAVQKEEVKETKAEKKHRFAKLFKRKPEASVIYISVQETQASKEAQTDVSVPATEPQPSDSRGEEAAAVDVAELPRGVERLFHKATQTDKKTKVDVSTQTDDNRESTLNTEGPMEEISVLNGSAVIAAEEVVENAAREEPSHHQTAGVIITDVDIEDNVRENVVFAVERVEVTDNYEIIHIKNYNPEEGRSTGPEETEPGITREPESNTHTPIVVDEIAAEENVTEEVESLAVVFGLPKVVADCIEAVFTAVSEPSGYAAVNTSEPRVDEVITEDNHEGAGDTSADVALIETAGPGPNAATPEAGEENGVSSLDGEPVAKVMETISQVVHGEPIPTPGDQDMTVEGSPVPLEAEILLKMEPNHEEDTDKDATPVEDVPKKLNLVSDDEPSEKKCDSCPEEEIIIVKDLSEDCLISPEDESIPEIIFSDTDVVIADEALIETVEPEPNAVPPEATEEEGIPIPDFEPVLKIMEAISQVVCNDSNPTPEDQEMPVQEPSGPLETDIVVKMDSAEEVTTHDAAAVENVPEKLSPVSDDEPSENTCYTCPKKEMIAVGGNMEAPSREKQLITFEEVPQDRLTSPDDEIKNEPQSAPEVIVADDDIREDEIVDVLMNEITKPEPIAVTSEAGEANSSPSFDFEPVIEGMEIISQVICNESNPTPEDQNMPAEEPSSPLETDILVEMDSAHEEVTANDAAVEDDPKGGIMEAPSTENQLITFEEVSQDSFTSLQDEIKIKLLIVADDAISEDEIANVSLIETTKPEPNAEVGEANGIPSFDFEPVIEGMETISQVICNESNPTPEDQDMPAEEPSSPLETNILVKMDSAHEEVTAAVEDDPKRGVMEAPSRDNQLITFEEVSQDSFTSPKDEIKIKLESISEIIVTDDDISGDEIAEAAKPEPNAEAGEANSIPSFDFEPVIKGMETISQVICNESNPTPEDQDMPAEEPSSRLETNILVGMDSAHEEVTANDDAVHQLITFEEVPVDSLSSPDDEIKIKLQSISELMITDDDISEDEITDGPLIETTESEPDTITLEAGEAEGVPFQDFEPVTDGVEIISQVVCNDPDLTPEVQDMPSIPPEPEILVKKEYAHEVINEDAAAAAADEGSDDEPSEKKCNTCPKKEIITILDIMEAPSKENQLFTLEELSEDCLSSPDEFIPEITSFVVAIADVAPEIVEEPEVSSATVQEDAEGVMETAIDALCLGLVPSAVAPPEPETDNIIPVVEEIFATCFVPLTAEQKTCGLFPEEQTFIPSKDELVAEEIKEKATQSEISGKEPLTEAAEEPVEPTEELSEDADKRAVLSSAVAVEVLEFNPVICEEAVKASVSPLEQRPKEPGPAANNDKDCAIEETSTDGEEPADEPDTAEEKAEIVGDNPPTEVREVAVEVKESSPVISKDCSGHVLSVVEDNTKDGAVDESVAAVVEVIVEEIIREDVVETECNPVSSEDVTSVINKQVK